MAGSDRQMNPPVNEGRILVQAIGTLSIVGGIIFWVVGIPAISIYLLVAGIIYWLSTRKWTARYQRVLDAPPEGFVPTGEVYINPGSDDSVAVYYHGIRRVYVRVRRP